MEFEWDAEKNRENAEKHGLTFEEASRIFEGYTLDIFDDRFDYGEVREISIGLIGGAATVTVTHTDRQGICRIISARPAVRSERRRYEEALRKAFDD